MTVTRKLNLENIWESKKYFYYLQLTVNQTDSMVQCHFKKIPYEIA